MTIMKGMFSALGVLGVDHYAVTTSDLMTTLKDFLSIPQAKLIRGPGENFAQKVNYAFVELSGMGVVEILSPLDDESPILSHLKSGAGAYHLCYSVRDLDQAIDVAEKEFGARLVVKPRVDGAFDGRRVAFLIHSDHGLFELLEAYPSFIDSKIEKHTVVLTEQGSSSADKLLQIYYSVVEPKKRDLDFELISMDNCQEWDSFKHLLLVMEVEKEFELTIPSSDMSKLLSLKQISKYLDSVLLV